MTLEVLFNFEGFENKIIYSIGKHFLYIEDDFICSLDDFSDWENYDSFFELKTNYLNKSIPKEIEQIYKNNSISFYNELLAQVYIQHIQSFLKGWAEKYEKEVVFFFYEITRKICQKEPYATNFRICLKGDLEEEKKYEIQKHNRFFYGFFDETIKCNVDGKDYWFGYNVED